MSLIILGVTHGNFSSIQLNDRYKNSIWNPGKCVFQFPIHPTTPVYNGTSCIIVVQMYTGSPTCWADEEDEGQVLLPWEVLDWKMDE